MAYPKAFKPQSGYKWQIFTQKKPGLPWEHLDYARTNRDLTELLVIYKESLGVQNKLKWLRMPLRCWPLAAKKDVSVIPIRDEKERKDLLYYGKF